MLSTTDGEIPEPMEEWRDVGWRLTLYPDAREAAGVFRASIDGGERVRTRSGESRNPERSAIVAASRARTAVRRYCAANRLNRLGTLTYAGEGCHDPLVLRSDMADFFRTLRAKLGGKPFPYLWVGEWHKTDHGLHVHFAVGQFVKRSFIEASWGRGYVHIFLLGDLPVGSTALDEARKSARYLSKYVGKAFDERRIPGLHRYEVAQNFQPKVLPIKQPTLAGAVAEAEKRMGGPATTFTTSEEWEGWSGPRAVALSWAS